MTNKPQLIVVLNANPVFFFLSALDYNISDFFFLKFCALFTNRSHSTSVLCTLQTLRPNSHML